MIYGSWDISYNIQIFFSHLWPFFVLLPANSPKNENIKKMKKKHLEISSFYRSVPKIMIIPYNVPEILHDAMTHDGCNYYFSFWAIFALLPPPNSRKNEISSFYTSVSKIVFISYTVPEIWHVMDVIVVFHFGQFFAPLPH